jgi:hypothetical protein
MNYQQIQKYLKDQVLNIEIDTQNDNQEKITGLKTEFLTAKNLTKNQELTEVLTRFYDSVINTITPDEKYYQLPVVEQLTANYFATKKPNLGIKSNDGIEQAIADQHYKLLDKILAN